MFIKKTLNFFLTVLMMAVFIFLNPTMSLAEPTATQCADEAQKEYSDCLADAYATRGPIYVTSEDPTSDLLNCEKKFEEAFSKCDFYSTDDIGGLINPLAGKTVVDLISQIVRAILGIIGSIALILFIYSGIQWMTARGNPEQVKNASKTMLWTALGIFMIFSSYLILDLIFKALFKE